MRRLRGFFIHVGIICSFVCVIAGALDWYNPYMDFSGHAFFMYLLLCFSVISAAFLGKTEKRAAVCGKKGFEQRIVQSRQQNRGGIREEKLLERVSASDERKADKEKIKDLEIKKKAMEEELDELKGNTAKVFDSMMPDQEDLIVRILENLTSDQRAAILSKMSIANAASLTEKMMQKNDSLSTY